MGSDRANLMDRFRGNDTQHNLGVLVIAIFFMVVLLAPTWAEAAGASVSLDQGVRFTAPDGSPVTVSSGTYRLEAAGDNQLSLQSDRQTETYILKAVPLFFDIRIDRPTALFIPDEPDVSHLVLALPRGKGYDARTWTNDVHARDVAGEALSREKLNVALAALGESSSSEQTVSGDASALAMVEQAPESTASDNEIESRGGLSPSPQILAADVEVRMSTTANPSQQEMSYELTIFNQGKDLAQDVQLSLALREPGPPGVRVKVAPSKKICRTFDVFAGNPVVTCSVSTLAVGQSLTVNVVLANPGNGPRYSIAQVMSVTPDPNPGNNWATNIGHGAAASGDQWIADLAVVLTGTVDLANQFQTYELSVTNQGDDAARQIVMAHTFATSVPGTSIVKLEPRGGAMCSSKELSAGLPVIICTVPQLGVRDTAGATFSLRNPGNGSRTSTAQAMSIVPDFNRANNSLTITVPPGSGSTAQQTTAPSSAMSTQIPVPPSGMVLSPMSPMAGGATPMILQPKVVAPVLPPPKSPTAPSQSGKYRVVINGLRISRPTADHALNSDGWGDEVYAAAAAQLYNLQLPQGERLVAGAVVKSLVHGQQNSIGSRIMAGHRTATGGITGNDWIPNVADPALPHGTPSGRTFPFIVYEGPLADNSLLIIHPTIWEYDGSDKTYQRWEQRWMTNGIPSSPLRPPSMVNLMALANDPLINSDVQKQMQTHLIEVTMGQLLEDIVHDSGDRPIGLERVSPPTTVNPLQGLPPIIYALRDRYVVLTRTKIEAELSSPSTFGNIPPGLITIKFVDGPSAFPIGDIKLEGDYTMYLRVEKLQ